MNNNNNFQNQFDIIDIISVLSFMLGLQNLNENRLQSAHNDVQAANSKQEKHLMDNLTKLFQEQNEMLEDIQERLRKIEKNYLK